MTIVTDKSHARLAAVMACYGQIVAEEDAQKIKDHLRTTVFPEMKLGRAAPQFVERRIHSFLTHKDTYYEMISNELDAKWPITRVEKVLLVIMMLALDELVHEPETHQGVIIDEYLHIVHAFYDKKEAAFVNPILQRLAILTRSTDSQNGIPGMQNLQ